MRPVATTNTTYSQHLPSPKLKVREGKGPEFEEPIEDTVPAPARRVNDRRVAMEAANVQVVLPIIVHARDGLSRPTQRAHKHSL